VLQAKKHFIVERQINPKMSKIPAAALFLSY
jgi:hypothetical protein